VALATASGCAKNVDHIEFKKWGNSFVPPRTTDAMDTSVQGGAAQNGVVPKNGVNAMPKAAVGGTYHRTFASSNHYRMVGGFHTPSGQ
jgi:hypothetical protein